MDKVLSSNRTFLERYVSRLSPKQRSIRALVAAGVVVGGSWFVLSVLLRSPAATWPIIGRVFKIPTRVLSAIALGHGVPAAVITYLGLGKKKGLQGGASVEKLARAVGGVLFLPLLAQSREYIGKHPKNTEQVKKFVKGKIIDWGYSEAYADNLISTYWGKSSNSIESEFKQKIATLKALKKREKYEGCSKNEIPYEVIEVQSNEMVKEFQLCC